MNGYCDVYIDGLSPIVPSDFEIRGGLCSERNTEPPIISHKREQTKESER